MLMLKEITVCHQCGQLIWGTKGFKDSPLDYVCVK